MLVHSQASFMSTLDLLGKTTVRGEALHIGSPTRVTADIHVSSNMTVGDGSATAVPSSLLVKSTSRFDGALTTSNDVTLVDGGE